MIWRQVAFRRMSLGGVMTDLAKGLILAGIVLISAGMLVALTGKISWIGRLPGDIFIQRENFSFYPPTQKTPALKTGMNALDGSSEALPLRTERRGMTMLRRIPPKGLRYPRASARGASFSDRNVHFNQSSFNGRFFLSE